MVDRVVHGTNDLFFLFYLLHDFFSTFYINHNLPFMNEDEGFELNSMFVTRILSSILCL